MLEAILLQNAYVLSAYGICLISLVAYAARVLYLYKAAKRDDEKAP